MPQGLAACVHSYAETKGDQNRPNLSDLIISSHNKYISQSCKFVKNFGILSGFTIYYILYLLFFPEVAFNPGICLKFHAECIES